MQLGLARPCGGLIDDRPGSCSDDGRKSLGGGGPSSHADDAEHQHPGEGLLPVLRVRRRQPGGEVRLAGGRCVALPTQLGAWFVVVLAIVVSVVAYLRPPNRWIPVFLLTVLVGQWLLTNGIKELLDRVWPTLNPIAETLGPSSPAVTRPQRRRSTRPRHSSSAAV